VGVLISRFVPEVGLPFETFASPSTGEILLRHRLLLHEVGYLSFPDGTLHLLIALKTGDEPSREELLCFLSEICPGPVLRQWIDEEIDFFGETETVTENWDWLLIEQDGLRYLDVHVTFRWHRWNRDW
jgi:hypothetical protein